VSTNPGPTPRPNPTPYLVVAVALTVTALSGCSSRNEGRNPFDGSSPTATGSEEAIRVEVQNLNFNDVTVWAVRQGQRIRLGRVTGKTDETFRLNWNPGMPISFVIDVTGGRSCGTGQIGVEQDAVVWVTVPANVGSQPCYIGRR